MGTMICFINIIGIVPVYYECNVCDALVASWITDDLQLCLIKMCQMLSYYNILSDYNNCSPAHRTPGRSSRIFSRTPVS